VSGTDKRGGPAGDPVEEPGTAGVAPGEHDDEGEPDEEETFGIGSFLRELPIIIVAALVISVLVKTFLVQAFYIPSGSMEDTLLVNDRVLVNKLADKPDEIHRGDVVVFKDPGGWLQETPRTDTGISAKIRDGLVFLGLAPATSDEDLIKRVIGVGGDHVVGDGVTHKVSVNGVVLSESAYLFPGNTPTEEPFDVRVPKGSLWVMGDHRDLSEDSRSHHVEGDPRSGLVPVDDVIGRAFVVVWPPSRFGRLKEPDTFDQPKLHSAGS
jgi:signal peptidase I